MQTIETASDAIDALGGTGAVAKLLQTTYGAVYQWRTRGLPRDTYIVLQHALTAKGLKVSPALWRLRGAA